ncbi:hypothetical protein [Anaerovorax odorimutans]|nr:hypothetical protein [Anaerovorax odorimutans]
MSGTYVDTLAYTENTTYDVRVIVTGAINVTSASAENRDINIIAF